MKNNSSKQPTPKPPQGMLLTIAYRAVMMACAMVCCCELSLMTSRAFAATTPNVTVTAERIASFDGVHLQGTLFAPERSHNDALLPAVILINPWALPPSIYNYQAKKLAQSGFVVLSYTARGFGASEGEAGIADSNDTQDMSAWIDWLIANTQTDPNKIGVLGISLGAGIALVAAAHDERIKAVCALSGWTDLYRTFYHQQTAPRLWGDLLVLSGKMLGHVEKGIETMFHRLRDYNISSQELHAWTDSRSPINYLDVYAARELPIYLQHNIGDNLFDVGQTIEFYQRLTGPKKIDLNLGEHITAELLALSGIQPQLWDRAIAWFGLYLRGEPSSLLQEENTGIRLQRSHATVRAEEWPRTAESRYYLGLRESLSQSSFANQSPATTTIKNAWLLGASSGIPIISTTIEAHTGIPAVTLQQLMLRDRVAVFKTGKLDAPTQIVGNPKVDLWVSSSSPTVQMVAYLYTVNFLGMAFPISYGAVTLHDIMTTEPQKVSFEMKFASYAVPQGSHIMLAIGTSDPYYASPKAGKYKLNFFYGGDYDAHIDLPSIAAQ